MPFNYYTIIIGMICGVVLFFKMPRLTKTSNNINTDGVKISVIIPARNEENNLPSILQDLNNQTIKVHEIICVDDNSEDRTPLIIKEYGVKKIEVKELPSGWKGKTWACQNGAKAASGDILLFIDADVRLSRNAIKSLINQYVKTQNPISVQPYHTMEKQHEYFSLFFNLIEVCSTAMCLLGAKKTYGFFGPVFMISKDLFDKHEGYAVVKSHVIEDFSLGNYYNKNGIKINLFIGADEIKFRMYPNSFSSVFEAWARNFSSGSLSTKFWLLLMIICWVACLTAIPIELARSISSGSAFSIFLVSAIYLLNVIFIYRMAKALGSYPFYVCLLYPVYLLAFHIIFLYSLLGTYVFKSTTWKGRKL